MTPSRWRLALAAALLAAAHGLVATPAAAQAARPPGVVADAEGSGPAALRAQLAAITTEVPVPARRVIFIGAALHGRQDMADQDVAAAAQALRGVFGAAWREVRLSNLRIAQPPRRLPLATIEHLDDVFEALAEHRRPGDRFIVMLASQGRPHLLEVEQAARYQGPRQLTSDKLAAWAQLLQGAPQWWVIAACHGGSHLDALGRPGLMAMAASADDRSSFRCDDREPRSGFVAAWLQALEELRGREPRATLAQWWSSTHTQVQRRERERGLPASQPQLIAAPDMEARLHGPIVAF